MQHLQTTLTAAFVGNRTGSRGHDGPQNTTMKKVTSVGGKRENKRGKGEME